MDFIVNNWLWFLAIAVFFAILMFVNFAMMASRFSMKGWNIVVHLFCGMMIFLSAIPFVIGTVVHIIQYANKH